MAQPNSILRCREIPMLGLRKEDLTLTLTVPDHADTLVVLAAQAEEKEEKGDGANLPLPAALPSRGVEAVDSTLKRLIQMKKFKGKAGERIETLFPSGSNFEHGIVVGLGCGGQESFSYLSGCDVNKKEFSPFRSYAVGREIGKAINQSSSVVVAVPPVLEPPVQRALVEGLLVASVPENRFKSEPSPVTLKTLALEGVEQTTLDAAVQNAQGVLVARELVDAPCNVCNPESLAAYAMQLKTECGLEGRVLGRQECEAAKMGAYLAVNAGSSFEPQFIHLIYKPKAGAKKRTIVLIGKGLTMDTGGYNIKNAACLIEQMKTDMGGAAAVLGAAKIIAARQPEAEVHFIVAAAENMVSSHAYRPGDILTASNGKTIVVENTDAEGRLTLADALVYAERNCNNPDAIIDCATLTGALMVGLGTGMAGVYGTCDKLRQTVLESGKAMGEAMWPMPLFKPYSKYNEASQADITNCPSARWGGSISAAHFLHAFVEKTPWVHVDLPGPVFDAGEKLATGYGARFLAETACRLSSSN